MLFPLQEKQNLFLSLIPDILEELFLNPAYCLLKTSGSTKSAVMAPELASPLGSKAGPLRTSERHCSLRSPRMRGPSPGQTRHCCCSLLQLHSSQSLQNTAGHVFWCLAGKEYSIVKNRKGKGDNTMQKNNLCLQTDHGVIKQTCKVSLLVLVPCKEGQAKTKSCFQRLQVRHVTTQAVVSEVLPLHSPPSQLTHPSVVSCMNASCQSDESLLLQPYQQQI